MESTGSPATLDSSLCEFAISFAETATTLFAAGGVAATLASVVELAVATIDGCDFAGLFLIEGDTVTTPVHTHPIVVEIDALQHSTGEGPCLDAIAPPPHLLRRRPGPGPALAPLRPASDEERDT